MGGRPGSAVRQRTQMSETTQDSRPERATATHDAAVAPELPAPTTDPLAAAGADRLLADPHVGERGNSPVRIAALQRMQHTYGNRATARWLNAGRAAVQREDVDTAPAPTQAAPAGPAGAMTQATQEAEAAQT